MKEYGISITGTGGEKITVYFVPMTYMDWKSYSSFSNRYELPNVRYLIRQYVIRAYKITDSQEEVEISFKDIMELPPTPINKIIDMMFDKAGFGSLDLVRKEIEEAEQQSMTLIGIYDRFILMHGGIEMYMSMLEQNVHVRANVISAMELITDVKVADRFDDSLEYEIPIDIITPKDKYDNMIRRRNKGQHVPVPRQNLDRSVDSEKGNSESPTDMTELVELSRTMLSKQLTADKGNRSKRKVAFDWMRDEQDYVTHSNREERDILNTKLPSNSEG